MFIKIFLHIVVTWYYNKQATFCLTKNNINVNIQTLTN